MRRIFALLLTISCACALAAPFAVSAKPRPRDAVAPVVSIGAPSPGATVSGTIEVTGTASDNVRVAKVEVRVDGGAYAAASGTGTWSRAIDTRAYGDGSHVLWARATDTSGRMSETSVSVTFHNASPPPPPPPPLPPPPPPPADVTAPAISISAPAAGAVVAGIVQVAGSASDDVALAGVQISVDGGAERAAVGTATWTHALDTRAYADGTHTITARADDSAGNSSSTTISVVVKNTTPLPDGVVERMITPEGATIEIHSGATGWTAQQIYDLLKPNALDLDRLGPGLKVKVQTTYASATSASVSESGGVYSGYRATIYLQAKAGSSFMTRPDFIMAHEYGHAWTLYHLYMSQSGDWSPYLAARGLEGDPRVDSSYNWSKDEMIADDYRMLFGTAAAVAQAGYINSEAADPRTVPGLRDFLLTGWAVR